MLEGAILPPRFNLNNDLMVRKHVHAATLTTLHALARNEAGLPAGDRDEIRTTLESCFPTYVRDYLFEDGNVRSSAFDISPFKAIVSRHRDRVLASVHDIFTQGWPEEDAEAVEDALLGKYVDQIDVELAEVLERLRRRLRWALDQMARLDTVRSQTGVLDSEERALYFRCERLVRRLKGLDRRDRAEGEGFA